MRKNIEDYTEKEIEAAIYGADIETAIALWKEKDWQTYKAARDTLVALMRAGRGNEVQRPQFQFIYFVNSHLRPRFPNFYPEWRMFTMDLPAGRSMDERSWEVATRGEFWDETVN